MPEAGPCQHRDISDGLELEHFVDIDDIDDVSGDDDDDDDDNDDDDVY